MATSSGNNKSSSTTIPVIAGLAIGVALIVLFSFVFNGSGDGSNTFGGSRSVFNFQRAESETLLIVIHDMPTSLEIGAKLQPIIKITGTAAGCRLPPHAEVRDLASNEMVWSSGLTTVFCDPDAGLRSVNIDWTLGRGYVESGVYHLLSNNNAMVAQNIGRYELTIEYAGLKESRVFDVINDAQNDYQEKLVSITKELPIVKEFIQRYEGTVTITTTVHSEPELLSKFQKYNPQSLVYYSIRHELAEDVHKELQLTVVIDNDNKPALTFMQCLGPISVEMPLISPDLWSMADDCVTK